jgi:hypothetical protein
MDDHPGSMGRRSFLGWVAKVAAGAAALVGASVGYAPRALSLHGSANCIQGTRRLIMGPCTVTGAIGPCVRHGVGSCVDVCNGNRQCITNLTGRTAKIKCTCHDRRCCLVPC